MNEGLTAYMEEIEIQGCQARKVGHDPKRLNTMRTAEAPRLSKLLIYSRSEWYNEKSLINNFAFSWSVIRFMISDRRYTVVLGSMLNTLAEGKCTRIDILQTLEKNVAGGVVAFERSWYRWLKSGKEGVQVF